MCTPEKHNKALVDATRLPVLSRSMQLLSAAAAAATLKMESNN